MNAKDIKPGMRVTFTEQVSESKRNKGKLRRGTVVHIGKFVVAVAPDFPAPNYAVRIANLLPE